MEWTFGQTLKQLLVPPLPSSALVLISPSLLKQDSPINKLLYARDIPRYKQMVERCVQI